MSTLEYINVNVLHITLGSQGLILSIIHKVTTKSLLRHHGIKKNNYSL